MIRAPFVALALLAAVPAAAQESGGVPMRQASPTLQQIEANRGCQLSATKVTVGVNKANGTGSSAQQRLATANGTQPAGCSPLVSTQVVTGVNLGLGRGSNAGQTIDATGQHGALGTNTYTRGVNAGVGASSIANQRIINQVGR
jgi:hypothetical protein